MSALRISVVEIDGSTGAVRRERTLDEREFARQAEELARSAASLGTPGVEPRRTGSSTSSLLWMRALELDAAEPSANSGASTDADVHSRAPDRVGVNSQSAIADDEQITALQAMARLHADVIAAMRARDARRASPRHVQPEAHAQSAVRHSDARRQSPDTRWTYTETLDAEHSSVPVSALAIEAELRRLEDAAADVIMQAQVSLADDGVAGQAHIHVVHVDAAVNGRASATSPARGGVTAEGVHMHATATDGGAHAAQVDAQTVPFAHTQDAPSMLNSGALPAPSAFVTASSPSVRSTDPADSDALRAQLTQLQHDYGAASERMALERTNAAAGALARLSSLHEALQQVADAQARRLSAVREHVRTASAAPMQASVAQRSMVTALPGPRGAIQDQREGVSRSLAREMMHAADDTPRRTDALLAVEHHAPSISDDGHAGGVVGVGASETGSARASYFMARRDEASGRLVSAPEAVLPPPILRGDNVTERPTGEVPVRPPRLTEMRSAPPQPTAAQRYLNAFTYGMTVLSGSLPPQLSETQRAQSPRQSHAELASDTVSSLGRSSPLQVRVDLPAPHHSANHVASIKTRPQPRPDTTPRHETRPQAIKVTAPVGSPPTIVVDLANDGAVASPQRTSRSLATSRSSVKSARRFMQSTESSARKHV